MEYSRALGVNTENMILSYSYYEDYPNTFIRIEDKMFMGPHGMFEFNCPGNPVIHSSRTICSTIAFW